MRAAGGGERNRHLAERARLVRGCRRHALLAAAEAVVLPHQHEDGDRDDQKFLEIARDAGASVLITKDKALLKLGRRTLREGLFKIMVPEAWLKANAASKLE